MDLGKLFFLGGMLAVSCETQAQLIDGLKPVIPAPESNEKEFRAIQVTPKLLDGVTMSEQERDSYATNLANLALYKQKESKVLSRRLLGLALHLSPRNRIAVVSNHQLSRGLEPEAKPLDYSEAVFARLMLARAKLLKEQKNELDRGLAVTFVELAALLDPGNEDAVYEYEIQQLDGDKTDWDFLVTPKAEAILGVAAEK